MQNKQIKLALDIVGAIGLTIGGATAIPGIGLPPQVLAWGLLIAAICKAVSSQFSQVKGDSDEAQGITPAQISASQAIHDAAKVATVTPTVTITPTPAPK